MKRPPCVGVEVTVLWNLGTARTHTQCLNTFFQNSWQMLCNRLIWMWALENSVSVNMCVDRSTVLSFM